LKGYQLKEARRDKNWTLEKAAEKCGITPQYLSELERGIKINPGVKTLARIIEVYENKNILEDFIPEAKKVKKLVKLKYSGGKTNG
jgi:transcriptional regulator with XRE-family HTH domain